MRSLTSIIVFLNCGNPINSFYRFWFSGDIFCLPIFSLTIIIILHLYLITPICGLLVGPFLFFPLFILFLAMPVSFFFKFEFLALIMKNMEDLDNILSSKQDLFCLLVGSRRADHLSANRD